MRIFYSLKGLIGAPKKLIIKAISFARRKKAVSAVMLLVILIFGFRVFSSFSNDNEESQVLSAVSVNSVNELNKNSAALSLAGEVEALSQADLKSEISAKVTGVSTGLGRSVFAGQILVTFDAGNLPARKLQAEAGVQAAQAQLGQVIKGATDEQLNSAEVNLENARQALEQVINQNAFDTARTAMNNLSSVLVTHADVQSKYFSNNQEDSIRIADAKESLLFELFGEWDLGRSQPWYFLTRYGGLTERWDKIESGQNREDINVFLKDLKSALNNANEMLNLTRAGLSNANADAADKTAIETALTIINGQLASVSGQQQAIIGAQSAYDAAQSQLNLITASATDASLTTAESQLKQAQAALSLINSQLSKTVIRSPISGQVFFLDPFLRIGNLVSPGQKVVSVINNSGLQIRLFIDIEDSVLIEPGAEVEIEGGVKGIVSVVSPGINPETRKVEIIVAVSGQNQNLVAGQFVNVTIPITTVKNNNILLPLSAVRVTSNDAFVFVVDDEGKLNPVKVELGRIIGDSVEILSGIDPDLEIIISIRGLKEGQEVKIIEN